MPVSDAMVEQFVEYKSLNIDDMVRRLQTPTK